VTAGPGHAEIRDATNRLCRGGDSGDVDASAMTGEIAAAGLTQADALRLGRVLRALAAAGLIKECYVFLRQPPDGGGVVARIEPIPMDQAQGKARELLDELVGRGVEPGPMVRAMANAPALLRGYLDLSRAMKRSQLDRRIIERINLAVHEALGCDYCLVAHTRAARGLGVPEDEIQLARQGTSRDPAIAEIVAFARQVLAAPADIGDDALDRLHAQGYSDEQIAEVAGLVSLQLLTGSFNLIAGIHASAEGLREMAPRQAAGS
jgi:AhpD family alkylhydroperoxidase